MELTPLRHRSHQRGHLSGIGFLLIGGKKCGPVSYHIAVLEDKHGWAHGQGHLDGAHDLLLEAYRSYQFKLVLANGVELDASIPTLDSDVALVELAPFRFIDR